jgi:hypothetical protein
VWLKRGEVRSRVCPSGHRFRTEERPIELMVDGAYRRVSARVSK